MHIVKSAIPVQERYKHGYNKDILYNIKTEDGKSGIMGLSELKEYVLEKKLDIGSLAKHTIHNREKFREVYGIEFEDILTILDNAFKGFKYIYASAIVEHIGLRYIDNDEFKIFECKSNEEALLLISLGIVNPDILNITLTTDKDIWLEYEVYNKTIYHEVEDKAYILSVKSEDNYIRHRDFDALIRYSYLRRKSESYQEQIINDLIHYVPEQIMDIKELTTIKNIDKRLLIKDDMINIFNFAAKKKEQTRKGYYYQIDRENKNNNKVDFYELLDMIYSNIRSNK